MVAWGVRIGLLHYAYAPVIGGVEFVMRQHASLLAKHGHQVRVMSGRGTSFQEGVEFVEIPALNPAGKEGTALDEELSSGETGTVFAEQRNELLGRFRELTADLDLLFVHNVFSMHFQLAATVALWELADENPDCRIISWVHDLAAINPDYDFPADRFPWTLLSKANPEVEQVSISGQRQRQLCQLTGLESWECPVVPNGVEVIRLLELTTPVRRLARSLGILYRDVVLIHPTRILPRKNVELGIRVTAALKARGQSCLYLVTGAPDPHNQAAGHYGAELAALVTELAVEEEVVFVGERFPVSDEDLLGLYALSDALFLPSRQEGFGLPLLEAGFFRLPVFCSAIEPMRSILQNHPTLFELDDDPDAIAALVSEGLHADSGYRVRKETILNYSWERILKKHLEPLFLRKDGTTSAISMGESK